MVTGRNATVDAKLASPSTTISFMKCRILSILVDSVGDQSALDQWRRRTQPYLFAGHNGKSDSLFADGHVKALSPIQTMSSVDVTAGGGSGGGTVNMWTRSGLPFTQDPNFTGRAGVPGYLDHGTWSGNMLQMIQQTSKFLSRLS